MLKERNYLWDNIKAFLITTVVVGHLLPPLNSSPLSEEITYIIFSFHMPAFVFASGYFAKSYCKDGVVRGEKVAVLACYYIVAQLLFWLLYQAVKPVGISLFDPLRGLWYLMAMVVYYLLIPVFEKLPWYITVPVFILLGFFIGIERDAGTFFSVSRIFVFAPFFFAGYYTTQASIDRLTSVRFRCLIGAVITAATVALIIFTWQSDSPYAAPIETFWAKSDYHSMHQRYSEGILFRAENYFFASAMIIGLIMLFPKKKTVFSYIGKNSLQIYVLHMVIIILIKYTDFFEFAKSDSDFDVLLLIVSGILLTLLLSIGIFSYPFKWIKSGATKLYPKH